MLIENYDQGQGREERRQTHTHKGECDQRVPRLETSTLMIFNPPLACKYLFLDFVFNTFILAETIRRRLFYLKQS